MNNIWQAYDDFNFISAAAAGYERLSDSQFASVPKVEQR
jgi:hypothetical protein